MAFTYFPNLPNGPDNPSNDQPGMQTNSQSINSLVQVDHIGFNANNGGRHTVVTCLDNGSDPAAKGGFGRYYARTINGDIQGFYISGSGVVNQVTPCLPLRAAVNFSVGAGPLFTVTLNGTPFNVTSVVRSIDGATGAKVYTITFTQALPSDNYYYSINGAKDVAGAVPGTLFGGPLDGTASVLVGSLAISFFNTSASQDPTSASVLIYGG